MSSIKPQLFVISGAGLSAESGLSTFRDQSGIWSQHDLNVVCNFRTWKENREKVFDFYGGLAREFKDAKPNAGHQILSQWQANWGADRVHLITQNVDLLLESAGCSKVTHLHGQMGKLQCTACGTRFDVTLDQYHSQKRCPKCKSLKGVKPAVVFFGEPAPEYKVFKHLLNADSDDAIVVVGSSMSVVTPDRFIARRRKGSLRNIQINKEVCSESFFGTFWHGNASQGLAHVDHRIHEWMSGDF